MSKIVITVLAVLLLSSCDQTSTESFSVTGVSDPIITLDGTWQVDTTPIPGFWKKGKVTNDWVDIHVPGELMMQGVPISHDEPFIYKKSFIIPEDYSNKLIKIQFDGVYSYAKVWINGNYLCDHYGGFTTWECDITSKVTVGKTVDMLVEVTDKRDDISYASGYAAHEIGGILRSVKLRAYPNNYPDSIIVKTDLDEAYNNSNLILSGKIKKQSKGSILRLELTDDKHNIIKLKNVEFVFDETQDFQIQNFIESPKKWDAEHPNLYYLNISFSENGNVLWQKKMPIGFREISIDGNRLLVNGNPVKLRGTNRHDIHPLLGRVSTPEYELKDILLAKEANINYIRASHYPPSENFLRLADEYGIYIEDETAVTFVDTYRDPEYKPDLSQNDPNYANRYLSQLKEMVNSHRNHPSIIIWSIGNESTYGTNFQKSYDWVKENDDTRPVKFSYPGTVTDGSKAYDILSIHYPTYLGYDNDNGMEITNFYKKDIPVVFDEWAHVAAYNTETIIEDPNVRDFWGISMDKIWINSFEVDSSLGGAIWGMIDETFMLPELNAAASKSDSSTNSAVGFGEWGIIDTWRRKKPEFWNTKKAYSPVKLLQTEIKYHIGAEQISIPLYNRFDHTNINELIIKLTQNNLVRSIAAPDISPHTKGNMLIPIESWNQDELLTVDFYDQNSNLIDKYNIRQSAAAHRSNDNQNERGVRLIENDDQLIIFTANNNKVVFNKNNGLFEKFLHGSEEISFEGPYLNLKSKGNALPNEVFEIVNHYQSWELTDFSYEQNEHFINVILDGKYDQETEVKFKIKVRSNNEISVTYQFEEEPIESIRELGIRFEMGNFFDSISWDRDAYWSAYPDNHLSAANGTTPLYTTIQNTYREKPDKNWHYDVKNYRWENSQPEAINDNLTYIAKATKERITSYSLLGKGKPILSILGDKDVNVRLAKNKEKLHLYANNIVDYVDLSWGNYQRNIPLEGKVIGTVILKIE